MPSLQRAWFASRDQAIDEGYCHAVFLMIILRRVIVLLAGSSLLQPLSVRAQSDLDHSSFWRGFLAGAAVILCKVYDDGRLSRSYTQISLKTLFEEDDAVPELARTKTLQRMRSDDDFRNCPLPKE